MDRRCRKHTNEQRTTRGFGCCALFFLSVCLSVGLHTVFCASALRVGVWCPPGSLSLSPRVRPSRPLTLQPWSVASLPLSSRAHTQLRHHPHHHTHAHAHWSTNRVETCPNSQTPRLETPRSPMPGSFASSITNLLCHSSSQRPHLASLAITPHDRAQTSSMTTATRTRSSTTTQQTAQARPRSPLTTPRRRRAPPPPLSRQRRRRRRRTTRRACPGSC